MLSGKFVINLRFHGFVKMEKVTVDCDEVFWESSLVWLRTLYLARNLVQFSTALLMSVKNKRKKYNDQINPSLKTTILTSAVKIDWFRAFVLPRLGVSALGSNSKEDDIFRVFIHSGEILTSVVNGTWRKCCNILYCCSFTYCCCCLFFSVNWEHCNNSVWHWKILWPLSAISFFSILLFIRFKFFKFFGNLCISEQTLVLFSLIVCYVFFFSRFVFFNLHHRILC